jgi:hypothetical protein
VRSAFHAAHTRSDGFRNSTVGLDCQFAIWGKSVNGQGRIVGNSKRYSGSADRGQSAWLYDGGSTVEIGPTDAAHTRGRGSIHGTTGPFFSACQTSGNAEQLSFRYLCRLGSESLM